MRTGELCRTFVSVCRCPGNRFKAEAAQSSLWAHPAQIYKAKSQLAHSVASRPGKALGWWGAADCGYLGDLQGFGHNLITGLWPKLLRYGLEMDEMPASRGRARWGEVFNVQQGEMQFYTWDGITLCNRTEEKVKERFNYCLQVPEGQWWRKSQTLLRCALREVKRQWTHAAGTGTLTGDKEKKPVPWE